MKNLLLALILLSASFCSLAAFNVPDYAFKGVMYEKDIAVFLSDGIDSSQFILTVAYKSAIGNEWEHLAGASGGLDRLSTNEGADAEFQRLLTELNVSIRNLLDPLASAPEPTDGGLERLVWLIRNSLYVSEDELVF